MAGPQIPRNSGAGFYNPGAIESEYERIQSKAPLPGVAPPAATTTGAPPPPAFLPTNPIDPNAPNVLDLIRGGKFDPPFTVTLMLREGMQVFKSDAGVKQEPKFVFHQETIREPADLLRIIAGMESEIYKPMNRMTLEFQLMCYLAYKHGTLDVPAQPPAPAPTEVQVQAEAETTVEAP